MEPRKRSKATESVGAKKAKQRSAASAAPRPYWCLDCWALAKHSCRRAHRHRLVDIASAQKDVAAEMAGVQHKLKTLMEAAMSLAPVLTAFVGEVDEGCCWGIAGGEIHIQLASTILTAEDLRALCKALEGLDLEYGDEGTPSTTKRPLKALKTKFPDYASGQCRERDILIDKRGDLTFGESKVCRRTKLFGRIRKRDVGKLCGSTCDEGSDCENRASRTISGDGTTLREVKLLADSSEGESSSEDSSSE